MNDLNVPVFARAVESHRTLQYEEEPAGLLPREKQGLAALEHDLAAVGR